MANDFNPTRREFMQRTAVGMSLAGLAPALSASAQEGTVPKRKFGNTGEEVAMLCLGGHTMGTIKDDQEAIALTREAIDMGVTFMDNAWEYHDGRSERLMGEALKDGYRDKVFLMSKHHGRKDKATAMKHLEDSLRRLGTDHLDLWQYHEIVYEDDPDMIFSEGGAIEAAEEAKKQGKVRYIGFTGHKSPAMHLDMLNRDYPWDAVQLPVNVMDPHYKSFIKEVLPVLNERGIAPLAMKTLGGGVILDAGVVSAEEAMRFAWSQPVATVVSGIDSQDLLHENVKYARNFQPMSEQEQASLLEKTKGYAVAGSYELFKSTRRFDGAEGRKLHDIPLRDA